MQNTVKAYPLSWPVGYKRTASRNRSQFKQTADSAQQYLRAELTRLGGEDVIVSSNIPIRADGGMYANAMNLSRKQQEDPGVAVYFNYKDKPVVLCCDTYERVWENVYAIAKTVENLRAIDRYGVSDFLSRSFTGFIALPESVATPYKRPWWEVLGLDRNANADQIDKAFKAKAKSAHPDAGGSTDAFQALKAAREEGLVSLIGKR